MADPSVALVIVAATSSAIYKCLCIQPFCKTTLRSAMMVHAYTIEIIQLLVVLVTVVNIYHVFNFPGHSGSVSPTNDPPPRVLSTLVSGMICLFTVDGFDNLIQIHRFTHPIQSQTLLLTRRWLFPGTVLVLKKTKKKVKFAKTTKPTTLLLSMDEVKRRSRLRRMSEPVTPTRIVPTLLSPVMGEGLSPTFSFGPSPGSDGFEAMMAGPSRLPTPASTGHVRQTALTLLGGDPNRNSELDMHRRTANGRIMELDSQEASLSESPHTLGFDSPRERFSNMTVQDIAEELQSEFNAIRAGMEFNLSRQYDSDSSDGSFGGYIREVSRFSQERDKILLPQLDEMQERFGGETCRKEEELRSMIVAQFKELKDTFGGPVR
ncbi:hypothetical protein TI39_contig322g00004 [Zymoseptoria brevis]|uniref:Uncharacterized protein n=1 Tax=Zymoseptoria brevis TaxID=1047168 RepID=A0A0F4GTN4_9PEZI|nr:hypothetical protein TI39_contig322g00004 [Zymoseptoria brevis]